MIAGVLVIIAHREQDFYCYRSADDKIFAIVFGLKSHNIPGLEKKQKKSSHFEETHHDSVLDNFQ